MIGIDLFAGAGGMSLGATTAGVRVKVAVEKDPYAARTYAHNHREHKVELFNEDIRNLKKDKLGELRLLQEFRSNENSEQIVVFGGPPCRGFSTSNQRTRSKDNPDNWLFKEYLRIAKLIQPDWLVFENVKGIIETEQGSFLSAILSSIQHLGYATSWEVLNAADYGVPQNRWRLFIVASLHRHRIDWGHLPKKEKITVKEAIGDLPELENGASKCTVPYEKEACSDYARALRGNLQECSNHLVTRNADFVVERYKHVPQGGNWEDIPEELMSNYTDRARCHTGLYHRLNPKRPSKVIGNFRKNMLIHPYANRGLSVREAARLQSFPDWYEFKGSIGFRQQQVGNAVPPLLAQVIFEQIMYLNCTNGADSSG